MKYLLLDTNIYLSIVVNRKKEINNKLIATFIKLLEYGEIKLVIPSIVKYETFKHIEAEVSKVGELLENAKKQIDKIYWVNGLQKKDFDIEKCKSGAKQYLQNGLDTFERNKDGYIENLDKLINGIFENEKAVTIKDDESLLNGALQRKIYQKAPFHNYDKESYGDALITEVLINLSKFIDIKSGDKIYFVSDNTSDFSSKRNKAHLHEHIKEDIDKTGLCEFIEYRTNFSKLIIVDLKEELDNANLQEEFEKELEEEQVAEEAMFYSDYEDSLRELFGLPSLSSFDYWMRDLISESIEIKLLLELFKEINKLYSELEEEIYYFYYDEIKSILSNYMEDENINEVEVNTIIDNFNKFLIAKRERFYCYSIKDIWDWIEVQENEVCFEFDQTNLDNHISLYENIFIIDSQKRKLLLEWGDTELFPESGETHTVYYTLRNSEDKEVFSEGTVEINYGYAEEDEDGNAGAGCEAGLDLNINPVIYSIDKIKSELEDLTNKHKNYVNDLKGIFGIV